MPVLERFNFCRFHHVCQHITYQLVDNFAILMDCIFIVKIKYDGQTFLENKVPDLSNALYNCLIRHKEAPENIEWRLFCGCFAAL